MTLDDFKARLRGVRRSGQGWVAFCPAHDDQHERSLSFTERDGLILVNCFRGCLTTAVVAAMRLTMADLHTTNGAQPERQIVATYDYRDERGTLLYQVVRFHPKDFRPRRPDGAGGWTWALGDVRRVVYHLDELAEQSRVFLCEGEKDADRLRFLGLIATTTPSGAPSWRDDYAQQIKAAGIEEVVALPDNDDPGRAYVQKAGASLRALGVTVRVLALPDLPEKGDVSDWLDAGHDVDELMWLARTAPIQTDAPAAASTTMTPLGIGLGQFLALDFPPPEAYIEGLLSSDGGGWMAGEGKLGKTYYTLEEGLCLAMGLDVCGRFAVPVRRRVLLLEEEDSPRRTQARLRALLRGHNLDPDDPDVRAQLDQWF